MLKRRECEKLDQEGPQEWRATVYLCVETDGMEPLGSVPSVDLQRVLCRCAATELGAEVTGEFIDWQLVLPDYGGCSIWRAKPAA